MKAHPLVIGLGHRFGGDDAVGPLCLEALEAAAPPGLRLRVCSGEGTALMAAWQGETNVVLIDAVRTGAPAGTLHRFDAKTAALPTPPRTSTHAFSLAEAISLSRTLDQLPDRLTLFGVEGTCFEPGATPSPAVRAAIPRVVSRVLKELPCRRD